MTIIRSGLLFRWALRNVLVQLEKEGRVEILSEQRTWADSLFYVRFKVSSADAAQPVATDLMSVAARHCSAAAAGLAAFVTRLRRARRLARAIESAEPRFVTGLASA